jgi:CheY-like chemotaxis protein
MSETARGRKSVVLVVEDETVARMNAVAIVEESGFAAVTARNADEAITAMETRSDIQAVFTDVQMPGQMDGLELAQMIRDRWPPVALLVTSGKRTVIESDLPNGGRFVPKPYLPSQIESVLRELLQG